LARIIHGSADPLGLGAGARLRRRVAHVDQACQHRHAREEHFLDTVHDDPLAGLQAGLDDSQAVHHPPDDHVATLARPSSPTT
jgi:hypothetical protein